MLRQLLAVSIGAGLLAGAASSPAVAQGVTVTVGQGLSFGTLTPGISQAVSSANPGNRGELTIQGSGQYTVQFVLPATLSGPTGAAPLPLVFGARDGVVEDKNRSAPFDPRVGTTVKLANKGESVTIGLGGTALPSTSQAAGSYNGTIVVIVAP